MSNSRSPSWRELPSHQAWLSANVRSLIDFYRPSLSETGRFIELDEDGSPLRANDDSQELLTVTRLTHSFALGEMLGIPGCALVVRRGLEAMWNEHRDPDRGGYFQSVSGGRPHDVTKAAYLHAHVLLAASSATIAGHDCDELLHDILGVLDERFWDDEVGASRESFSAEWREVEDYRGANSNMHLCEAYLAAGHATGDATYTRRALRIAELVIGSRARENDWMLPEHYDGQWRALRDYNREQLDDPFRPYGVTIGHLLEWSRLTITLWSCSPPVEEWTREASIALFDKAIDQGWDAVRGGLAYTVDFDGGRANPDKYWWPITEAIAAAAALAQITGDEKYETWYRTFWDYAAQHLIDFTRGGWYAELDSDNHRKVGPWYGKPDLYHILQCHLLPVLPVSASVAGALRDRVRRSSVVGAVVQGE